MVKMCDKILIFACFSMPCYHKSHMIALVTVHDFIFYLSMISFTHFEDLATMETAARANPERAHDSTHHSSHRRQQRAIKHQSDVMNRLQTDMLVLQFTSKVWYKSEKAFVRWPELHNSGIGVWIHNHSLWRTLDYCILPPIPLIV